MTFNAREFKEIARDCGVSDMAIQRLLADTRISVIEKERLSPEELINGVRPEQKKKSYLVGLNLLHGSVVAGVPRALLAKSASQAIQNYQYSCPLVVAWICRGDFNPALLPDHVSRSALIHACRTAGRIRATTLRALPG